ncbi:hypothetical protein PAMC26577_23595 [Caballeronia sordidicola]|uniref:Uncharacterized protein n=1 Tax=Caballeronia sordidicola TaxID=196367 RepID=A0A242MJF4_CABSO|nr:hypothetical protein PAMC26577_23595 [Caballeronia sordidicola]
MQRAKALFMRFFRARVAAWVRLSQVLSDRAGIIPAANQLDSNT